MDKTNLLCLPQGLRLTEVENGIAHCRKREKCNLESFENEVKAFVFDTKVWILDE